VLRNDAVRAADSAAAATAKAGNAANTQAAAPADGTPNTPANAAEPNREALLQAVDEVRKAIEPVAQDLLFSIDDDTGHTVVKVVDASTDEVIRQIPSAEVLAIAKALDKLQGVLIKQEA
jgi:flagellar protein FlaG